MNQKEIIEALTPDTDKKYYYIQTYAAKLVSLCKLIAGCQKLPGYKFEFKNTLSSNEMIAALPEIKQRDNEKWSEFRDREKQHDNAKGLFSHFSLWQNFTLSHSGGVYNFPIPVNNAFYNYLLQLTGCPVNVPATKVKELYTITVDAAILPAFATATKFVSNDDLRPVMMHVCMSIEKNRAIVIATDAHRMYYTPKYKVNREEKTQLN